MLRVTGAPVESEVEADPEDDEPLRWYAVVTFVLAIVGGFAVALWAFLRWTTTCDDKGLGSAAAGDSTRAMLCESGHGAAVLVIPAAWVLGLALAAVALVRWGGGPLRALVCGLLLLAPAGLPAAAYGGLSLSSAACSEDELAAYREWVAAGSKERPPYDCRTF